MLYSFFLSFFFLFHFFPVEICTCFSYVQTSALDAELSHNGYRMVLIRVPTFFLENSICGQKIRVVRNFSATLPPVKNIEPPRSKCRDSKFVSLRWDDNQLPDLPPAPLQ